MAGQKSFRRKYNKIRYQFKHMYSINTLYHEDEERFTKISKRLQEQNDQLLEILLDFNDSDRLPKHLRYVLEGAEKDAEVADLKTAEDISKAEQLLEEARQQVAAGDLMQRDYDILVAELKSSLKKHASAVQLSQMEQTTSHTSLGLLREDQLPEDVRDEEFSTYLDAVHEDAYLAQLDAVLSGTPTNEEPPPPKPVLSEAIIKNPVSTYNWLRANKPEVFVQEGGADKDKDKDKPDEKETKGRGSTPLNATRDGRSTKRGAGVEILDDDGSLLDTFYATPTTTSKSKRKRDDDAYRPKGGGSSKRRKKSSGKAPEAD